MNLDATLAAVLVLAAALVVAPVAAAAPSGGPAATFGAQDTETPTPEADENASVAPGEKLSGAIGVQQTEIEGEVDERTFGVKVAKAGADDSKARIVADQLDDVEQRLDQLEERKQNLKDARENGSISEGQYRAEMARVVAETESARRMVNASEETAQGLPAETLAEKGVDVEAIQTLKDRAGNLSGPEVAKIAQSIAGKDIGKSMAGTQKPGDVGEQLAGDRSNESGGPDDTGGAPNGTDGGAPDGSNGGAPNGTDDGAPDGSDNQP